MAHQITNRPYTNRHLSPTAQHTGGLARMLWGQTKAEFLQNFRVPEFLIGIVAIPVMLYAMFGLPSAAIKLPEGTAVGALMMASFSAYGILSLAIFTFGIDVANERKGGWLRLMRTTPVPAWVYFAAKFAMALLFAALTLLVMFAVGYVFAGVRMPLERWATSFAVLLLGALSFSSLGFALGYLARPKAASTIGNLVYLPLSFVSGFFFPLGQLPEFVQKLAPYLPTYHFGQLVWGSIGTANDVARFTGQTPGEPLQHALWLVGSFGVFGVLAVWGYGRDRGEQAR